VNPTRVDLYERFQKLLDDYNSGSLNVETYFKELVEFSRALDQEKARAVSRGLSEEQQTIFDLLTRPDPGLSAEEERQVKRVAEELLPSSSVTSWCWTGVRNSRLAQRFGWLWRRPLTVFPRSTCSRSMCRSATPCTSTCSIRIGTTVTPSTIALHSIHH
jgi:hypothetical protein